MKLHSAGRSTTLTGTPRACAAAESACRSASGASAPIAIAHPSSRAGVHRSASSHPPPPGAAPPPCAPRLRRSPAPARAGPEHRGRRVGTASGHERLRSVAAPPRSRPPTGRHPPRSRRGRAPAARARSSPVRSRHPVRFPYATHRPAKRFAAERDGRELDRVRPRSRSITCASTGFAPPRSASPPPPLTTTSRSRPRSSAAPRWTSIYGGWNTPSTLAGQSNGLSSRTTVLIGERKPSVARSRNRPSSAGLSAASGT